MVLYFHFGIVWLLHYQKTKYFSISLKIMFPTSHLHSENYLHFMFISGSNVKILGIFLMIFSFFLQTLRKIYHDYFRNIHNAIPDDILQSFGVSNLLTHKENTHHRQCCLQTQIKSHSSTCQNPRLLIFN